MADKPLSQRHQRFIEEYLVTLSATTAYIRVYGCKESTAAVQGSVLLKNPKIQEAIADRRVLLAVRSGVTPERVLEELARLGFSDMRKFTKWGPDGVLLNDSDALADDDARCVAEVSQTTTEGGGSLKFKLHDKVAALTQIGRHFGMFTDKIEDVSKLPREERKERLMKLLA